MYYFIHSVFYNFNQIIECVILVSIQESFEGSGLRALSRLDLSDTYVLSKSGFFLSFAHMLYYILSI